MKPALFLVLVTALCVFLVSFSGPTSKAQVSDVPPAAEARRAAMFTALTDSARAKGNVRVIVSVRAPFVPEGEINPGALAQQRRGIKRAQDDLLARLPASRVRTVTQFDYIPFMALEVDEEGLRGLESADIVTGIEEDVIGEATLAESTSIVGAPAAWSSGYTGAGQTIAIVDSGVDKNHPFFGGRVVSEACYSSNVTAQSTSVCPAGVTESTAVDSGLHCPTSVNGCAHGTNVAGIAAGAGATASGVAKGANIIAVQVFSRFEGAPCGGAFCARYWTSDLIRGIERIRTLKASIPNIAAVNLSLGTSQQFTSNCDTAQPATKAAIDNLRTLGVATVISSGNLSLTNAMTAPACISSAISVGSVDDGSLGTGANNVSSFSNSSPLLHLLAPGRWINSSIPNNSFENYSGTSMAAPHVTGAYAVLRQRSPNASVGRIVKALSITGQPITDSRNGLVKPRINVGNALNALNASTPADFDDDGKTDISIFRPTDGTWWINRSLNGSTSVDAFGTTTDRIVPADYTGDGRTDIAFWQPSTGNWFILRSEDRSFFAFPFGTIGDVPVPADYDNDGKADPAVFRPSNGVWFIQRSSDNGTTIQQFGSIGDVPVAADYDGDGRADLTIFRPVDGTWWLNRTTAGVIVYQFGETSDKLVPGDYTGDGKTDVAFWRPSNGFWYILRSEDSSFYAAPFGAGGDIPAPGDYDGDGKFDVTVFRPSEATWYSQRSTAGILIRQFGAASDRPIPNVFVP